MKNDVIFPNQSEPVFSWSQVKVWVRWSDPQMCWWNAFNLIRGSNCRSDLIWISWTAVWSPLVKRALSEIFSDTKRRADSLRQLSFLFSFGRAMLYGRSKTVRGAVNSFAVNSNGWMPSLCLVSIVRPMTRRYATHCTAIPPARRRHLLTCGKKQH